MIADEKEILEFLSAVMREGSGTGALKAAELLGKRLGLFTEKPTAPEGPTVIVDDVDGTAQ
ncbi:MAG: hypothetical protein MJ099_01800 [Clostridia bacterium]|nr:hypothetical protein [Clostridia bacterium]